MVIFEKIWKIRRLIFNFDLDINTTINKLNIYTRFSLIFIINVKFRKLFNYIFTDEIDVRGNKSEIIYI